ELALSGRAFARGLQKARHALELAGDAFARDDRGDLGDGLGVAPPRPPRGRPPPHALEWHPARGERARQKPAGAATLPAGDETLVDDCDRTAGLTQLISHTQPGDAGADHRDVDVELGQRQRPLSEQCALVARRKLGVPDSVRVAVGFRWIVPHAAPYSSIA